MYSKETHNLPPLPPSPPPSLSPTPHLVRSDETDVSDGGVVCVMDALLHREISGRSSGSVEVG